MTLGMAVVDMAGTTVRENGIMLDLFGQEMHATVDRGELTALPGAADALRRLSDLGLKFCLTTGLSPALCAHLVDALGWRDVVDLALSAEEVGRDRPSPDLVLTALMRLRVDSVHQVATVGETVNDVVAEHVRHWSPAC